MRTPQRTGELNAERASEPEADTDLTVQLRVPGTTG